MAIHDIAITPDQERALRVWRWSTAEERAFLRRRDWRGGGFNPLTRRTYFEGRWCCPWGIMLAAINQGRGLSPWLGIGENPAAGEITALLAERVIDSYAIVLDDDHLAAILAEVEQEAQDFVNGWDSGDLDPPVLLAYLDRLDRFHTGAPAPRGDRPLLALH